MQRGFGARLANGNANEDFHFGQNGMNGGDAEMRRASRSQGTDLPEPLSDLTDDEFERLFEANEQRLKEEEMATASNSLSCPQTQKHVFATPNVSQPECSGQQKVQTENEKNFFKTFFPDRAIPPGEISRLKAKQQLNHFSQKQPMTQQNKNRTNFYERGIDVRTNPARDFRNFDKDDEDNCCLPRSSQALSLMERINEATRHVDLSKLSSESIALINMEDPLPTCTTDKNSMANAQFSADNNFLSESRELGQSASNDANILQAERSKSCETVQNLTLNTKETDRANHTSRICEDDPEQNRRSQSDSLVRQKSTELQNGNVDFNTSEDTSQYISASDINICKKDGPSCIYKDLDWNGEPEIDWEGKKRGIDDEKDKHVKATSKSVDVATNTDTNDQQKKDFYIFFDMNESVPDAPMQKSLLPKLNGISQVSNNAEWNKQAQPTSYTVLTETLNDAKPLDEQIRSVDANVEIATNKSKHDATQDSRVNHLAAAIALAVMCSPEGCLRLSKLRTFMQKCYGHSLENDFYDLVKLGEFIQQNCGPNVTFNRRENNDALIVYRNMEDVETS
ncbi:hypothetical protein Ddc_01323 [Ditylenchus destructor]|nr:hypothetical protein Ddc_01323 [Ditylenchus destructor]